MEDITKKVMNRVVGWERKRVVVMLVVAVGVLIILLVVGLIVVREVGERQISAELEILGEDWEVVRQFGAEVVQTIWEELPRMKLGVILVVGIVGWGLGRKWPVVKKKISYLTKHG